MEKWITQNDEVCCSCGDELPKGSLCYTDRDDICCVSCYTDKVAPNEEGFESYADYLDSVKS